MFAIKFGIQKFEYELRGRKFHIKTDHKCLQEIVNKNEFKNAKINRWLDEIQQHDFTISYKKGEEIGLADSLSRLPAEELEIEKSIKLKIFESHLKVGHRGVDETWYALDEETRKIDNIRKIIKLTLENCKQCIKYNDKNYGGSIYVTTNKINEKWGLDIMNNSGKYVLIAIDYFSRLGMAEEVQNKSSQEIIKFLKRSINKWGKPDEIVTDNAKEFIGNEFEQFLTNSSIIHRKTSKESHKSNGRVERLIKTIRKSILKSKDLNIKEIMERYNNTRHSAIKGTPCEVINGKIGALDANQGKDNYAARFKTLNREEFH